MIKKTHPHHHADVPDSWIAANWRPMAALVYLAICVFDFIVAPVAMQIENHRESPTEIVQLATEFHDGATQIAAMTLLHEQHIWTPLTLAQNGLFHIAFGALLSVSAWTRGREKEARIRADIPTTTITGNHQQQMPIMPPLPPLQSMATTVSQVVTNAEEK